ncbi:MAG: hypothetical protein HY903_24405 [Deltaproteobacteria bacterium]|nr:hypothetical protein [Deltaproteobacteria bacterium]
MSSARLVRVSFWVAVLTLGADGASLRAEEDADDFGEVRDSSGYEPDVDLSIPEPAEQDQQAEQDEQERSRAAVRASQADQSFDDLMRQNAAPLQKAQIRSFNEIALQGSGNVAAATVEVPLRQYAAVRERLNGLRERAAKQLGPAVVLGAAGYTGVAKDGGLSLRMQLQVTLGQAGRYKAVPLVGDDVVVARATAAGAALTMARQNGYQVWVTNRVGEVTLVLDLWVPARGPRGSIEYDFLVPRTPVTTFECRFPVAGLEPRLSAAVRSEVRSVGNTTVLSATLRPTTRVHLVGFRDIGETEGRERRMYAETLSLLSIDESSVELFAVVRYTILYAGAKEFQIMVPAGMSVVSAEGEGAFRYETEPAAGGLLVRGETAFPIRNGYEISLRLRRRSAGGGDELAVPLLHPLGVEREQGYLAVEVPGKMQLQEVARKEALAIDVRQLPPEVTQSAVSPILRAYRYHGGGAAISLRAVRLPEREPASASIDRVRATSVVAADGQVLTDLRITLRNRLLPSLGITLPEGTEVRSTLLDGEPVKPSRDASGQLRLPLSRSRGGERLEPFTVVVVLSRAQSALGRFGRVALELPALELPAASLAWTLYVPANQIYSRPQGDIEAQGIARTASWHQAHQANAAPAAGGGHGGGGPAEHAIASADSGAMPVRIKLPESGVQLHYQRYWLAAAQPVTVSFWHLLGWLRLPLLLGGALLLLLGLSWWLQDVRLRTARRRRAAGGLALGIVTVGPVVWLGHVALVVLVVLAAVAVHAFRRGELQRFGHAASQWVGSFGERFRARTRPAAPWTLATVLWRISLGGVMAVTTLVTVIVAVQVVLLLFRPFGG